MDLSCKSINLFPTYFWKLKVPNHQIIKDKYLQSFIDGYDNNIYRVPKGWVTHKCHTSFEETKLTDKDICDAIDEPIVVTNIIRGKSITFVNPRVFIINFHPIRIIFLI